MIQSPLEQFNVIALKSFYRGELFNNAGYIDITITNATLFFFITGIFIAIFVLFVLEQIKLVPNTWQWMFENVYEFAVTLIEQNIGVKGRSYFPLIFSLFVVLLFGNLIGMVPYSFTISSHIILTFSLALAIFIGINIIGLREHGLHFFTFFIPQGAPPALIPFLIFIEIISYIFRVFSLSIRLFANMMSGHTLLKIMAGFSWSMISLSGVLYYAHLLPLIIVFALIGLEMGIAILQAYVFTVLICFYFKDALYLH